MQPSVIRQVGSFDAAEYRRESIETHVAEELKALAAEASVLIGGKRE
jgi:hypothetical protein